MNWKKFFFRLTVIISFIVAFVVFLIWVNNWDPYGKVALFYAIFAFICVWILYFGIKWVVKGLKSNGE